MAESAQAGGSGWVDGATSISIAVLGSGGAGALTTGAVLLEAACGAGWYGLMTRSVGPQIRGGEAVALLRLSSAPIECHVGHIDLLMAIDWENAARFESEIKLHANSLVVGDLLDGRMPAGMRVQEGRHLHIPLEKLCKDHRGWRENVLMLGAAAELLGISADAVRALVAKRFIAKGVDVKAANEMALTAGAEAVRGRAQQCRLPPPARGSDTHWLITGNEAVGLGVIRGGVRFAAAYPITPATEVLEWLAPALSRVGGTLVQAEDELASINMIIGASYGGTPSLTATSGPGLSLMTEALGLATAAEIPIVIIDVMRGGPSTGIPTKSEQSDLNIAIYGMHGDAPHLVVAPQSVADCAGTAQWAVALAEQLQTPVIILSDQFLGQARTVIERPVPLAGMGSRLRATAIAPPYKRYALTASGVSPMAIPGEPDGQYTAESLTHTERGLPTSGAADHAAQLDKRRDKLDRHHYGETWATIEGEGSTAVITWGSLTGVVREAAANARAQGRRVKLISPRLLSPVRPAEMARALAGVERLLVVEQTHGAQFHKYLRAHYELPPKTAVLHRAGPLTIRPYEVVEALLQGSLA